MAVKTPVRWRRWLLLLLSVGFVAACLAVELGSRFPGLGIPSWERIYSSLGLTPASAEGVLEVHFLDVGNADCILLRQGAHAALIDGGEPGDGEEIVEYLRRYGVDKLDFLLATHGHADHVGGLAQVVEAVPTGRLLVGDVPPAEEMEPAYAVLLAAAETCGVPIETVQTNAVYTVGVAQLQVAAFMPEAKEENDRSVVTRLTYGQRAFLFMGDAGTAVESALLQRGIPLQVDVLKIGHHGGKTSSSMPFLRRVAPAYGVIPCGEDNLHGHPSVDVLRRLQELEVTCLRNDVSGDIVFTTDGKSLLVETVLPD